MDEFAQLHGHFVFYSVVNTLAVFATGKNAAGRQQRKVLGDICLGGPDGRHNLVHAPRFLANSLQNAQPHRLTEYFESTSNPIQFFGGEKAWVLCS